MLRRLNRNGGHDLGEDRRPALAADSQGRYVAVWQSSESLTGAPAGDMDILASRFNGFSQVWAFPSRLQDFFSEDSVDDTDSALATDGQGHWIALWTTGGPATGGLRKVVSSLSDDAGQSRAAPLVVNGASPSIPSSSEANPDLESDGSGTWVATWEEEVACHTGCHSRVFVARSTQNGAGWSAALNVAAGWAPKVATDRNGTWVVAFHQELCDLDGCALPELGLARSTDSGDTWTTGLAPFPGRGARTSDIACDGNTWMVVWQHEHDADAGTDLDLGPRELGIRSSISVDGGLTWSEPQVVSLDAASAPRLAVEGPGRWLCVWAASPYSGFLPAERDILYARSTDNGQTWSEPVRLNRDTTFNETPVVAFDGQGRPMVVWSGKGGPEGREESRGEPRMGSSCFSVSGFEGTRRLESLRHFSRPPFCCSIALHRRKRSGLEFAEPGGMLAHAGTPAVRVADPEARRQGPGTRRLQSGTAFARHWPRESKQQCPGRFVSRRGGDPVPGVGSGSRADRGQNHLRRGAGGAA